MHRSERALALLDLHYFGSGQSAVVLGSEALDLGGLWKLHFEHYGRSKCWKNELSAGARESIQAAAVEDALNAVNRPGAIQQFATTFVVGSQERSRGRLRSDYLSQS